jgi:DNA-directed DNA polymerase III PolC
MFVHLNTHSYYSFLEALPSPTELVQAAVEHSMPALALTDRVYLTGAIEFYDACRTAGIHPILGLEVDVAPPPELDPSTHGPLLLLAQDLSGWGNLCRLSSTLLTQSDLSNEGYLSFKVLAQNTTGLVCLTGGVNGLLSRWVQDGRQPLARGFLPGLKTLFPDRLYVALERAAGANHPLSDELARLAKAHEVPVAATLPVFMLTPDQVDLQRTLTAIRLNLQLADLPPDMPAAPGSVFVSGAEMEARFHDLPEALAATKEIAERCTLTLPLGRPQYPEIPLPAGITAIQALREKAVRGAVDQYGELTAPITDRLEHELGIIEEAGYAALFLIMEELLQAARQADIPSASRGSASSSLVAHCLGITTPDPLQLNLYFERFLNPARRKPPDIDTDLCSRRRDEVIQHVYDRYGADRVAMVCTINRFRARSALREVAKAHGLSSAELQPLLDGLPRWGWGPAGRFTDPSQSPYAGLADRSASTRVRKILTDAEAILGFPRHLSIHPGGVVISPGQLTELVPTLLASKGIVITQLDLESIERLGLVKIDLLGIRGLTVLGDVADSLRERAPAPQQARLQVLEQIPPADTATASLVRSGRTIGCFQIESPGMRATLAEIQAENEEDVMVALALYRPGPLTGGLKDAFVRRHLGQEPVAHLHPALGPLLEDTYGVILYQEQVLRIANELAGLSLAEGDLLRRAMSHFDPGQQMITLQQKFIAGAGARRGVPPDVAKRVWELMAAFAGYGFPKAHAASYAQIAWRSAWCKAHHPAEFMAAVLANWGGYYRQRVYLAEARRLGLQVRPPHINFAQREFTVHYHEKEPVLYMGLDQVRDLTRTTQRRILQDRPFSNLSDFLTRVDPRPAEAEHLVKVGALAGMGTIPALLRGLQAGAWQRGQLQLFPPTDDEGEAWPLAEKAAAQEAFLGVSVDVHPLELVTERLTAEGVITSIEAAARIGQRVRVAGLCQTRPRRGGGTSGKDYLFALEDQEGFLDVLLAPAVYRQLRTTLRGKEPYIVEGVVESVNNEAGIQIKGERLWRVR